MSKPTFQLPIAIAIRSRESLERGTKHWSSLWMKLEHLEGKHILRFGSL
jgi:hypothetical protein